MGTEEDFAAVVVEQDEALVAAANEKAMVLRIHREAGGFFAGFERPGAGEGVVFGVEDRDLVSIKKRAIDPVQARVRHGVPRFGGNGDGGDDGTGVGIQHGGGKGAGVEGIDFPAARFVKHGDGAGGGFEVGGDGLCGQAEETDGTLAAVADEAAVEFGDYGQTAWAGDVGDDTAGIAGVEVDKVNVRGMGDVETAAFRVNRQ
jgi:hypothetical protein